MSAGVFGRDAELRTLAAFLDGVPASPSALVLAGPGGAGKTTLLRAGAASAAERAYAVLQTAPARSDVSVSSALASAMEAGVVWWTQGGVQFSRSSPGGFRPCSMRGGTRRSRPCGPTGHRASAGLRPNSPAVSCGSGR